MQRKFAHSLCRLGTRLLNALVILSLLLPGLAPIKALAQADETSTPTPTGTTAPEDTPLPTSAG